MLTSTTARGRAMQAFVIHSPLVEWRGHARGGLSSPGRSVAGAVRSRRVATAQLGFSDKGAVDGASHAVTVIGRDEGQALDAATIGRVEDIVRSCGGGGRVLEWRELSGHVLHAWVDCGVRPKLGGVDPHVNVVVQDAVVARADKRLAVFDLDSTLIQNETIDEMARVLGADAEARVAAITARAMNGELDFGAALAARVALLEGLPVSALQAVKDAVQLTRGAHTLVNVLRNRFSCRTAVISGGFDFLAEHIAGKLGLDHAFANRLATHPDGLRLAGTTTGPVVDAAFKANTLRTLAAQRDDPAPLAHTLAVGDGANDVPMLRTAGLGVAFNAKPAVQKQIEASVNAASLHTVLYLLGLSDDDIRQYDHS